MFGEQRFKRVYNQTGGSMEIWIDLQTGVNYLYRSSGRAGGLTVLLDEYGRPVVTPVEEQE